MIKEKSLVIYKNQPAIVTSNIVNGKFSIKYVSTPETKTKSAVYSTQNVREKDVLFLFNQIDSLENVVSFAKDNACKEEDIYNLNQSGEIFLQIKDAWELLVSDENTKDSLIEFNELVSLFTTLTSQNAWCFYVSIRNTLFFMQDYKSSLEGKICFSVRTQEQIDEIIKKENEKGKELEERQNFIQRLKQHKLLPDDTKYMVDVEALALGKTDRSKTLSEAKIKETPERAHKLLLDLGIWSITRNPYPSRWGCSMQSSDVSLESPPEEERFCVKETAYAIDGEASTDPDDAISYDGKYLWVHIADPASTVKVDSLIDKVAMSRGTTLYLPEGAVRMLSEDCLEDYALGLKKESYALSFKIELNDDCSIKSCEVLKTKVNVERLTYKQAEENKDSEKLKIFFEIARKNFERRKKSGAITISTPEVDLYVDKETKIVSIKESVHYESNDVIREMMLLAGEGAAKFAFENNIPFPYISQSESDIPAKICEGLAGQYQLRRCMKKRSVGVTPAMHCALGLSMYSQVTSPLRRYGDLIAHIQLRSFLDSKPLLDKDTMLLKISAGDEAARNALQSSRSSEKHWKLVYLLQNPGWKGKAICVDKTQKIPLFNIPSLGMETYMLPPKEMELNEEAKIEVEEINLPELKCDFKVCG